MDRLTDGQTDGQTDGLTDGQTDGKTDRGYKYRNQISELLCVRI